MRSKTSSMRSVLIAVMLVVLTSVVAVAADAGHADSGALLKDFLYRVLSFSIVVAILVYYLAKPIKKGLAGRREEIESALAEANQAKRDAEAKFAEYDRKLAQATTEIAEISAAIRREGELEKQKIIANAKELAIKIEQDAGKTAELEVAKARNELRREAVQLAIAVAEDLLIKNVTKEDDTRLIDEYMKKVGELH